MSASRDATMIVMRRLAFAALILVGFALAVGPLFMGPEPPMTDFCQHALVAHMINHYEDPQLNYTFSLSVDSFRDTAPSSNQ